MAESATAEEKTTWRSAAIATSATAEEMTKVAISITAMAGSATAEK